ncbi:MAG: addiction module toxin, HicA family [Microcystis flos-aquae Mf_WU_F_19750830_S460]|uniref:Addiction module toxin, HicA family n=1 Tax=Microcystis flos-aquae Mf_WU_F_19750830_S460 TaxID=2486237 RepID=A0A552L5V0_9CHRO|nr:MAG: addiction module toxin, HicA family [Microcystis flos-aquae Mf_WU_F_19750830_S460]
MKVRDVLKRLETDGWYQIRMRGSHRILAHETKSGIVVVPGKPGDDITNDRNNNGRDFQLIIY